MLPSNVILCRECSWAHCQFCVIEMFYLYSLGSHLPNELLYRSVFDKVVTIKYTK